jgi:exosortase
MSVPAARNLWKPVAIAAAITFVYAKVLAHLGHDWWTDENYSHGLLVPLIIGYILWASRRSLGRATESPSFGWGGALILFALLMLWAGTAGAELYVQRISMLLMLVGVVIYFWGFHLLKLLLLPFALLFLAIPIPAIVFNKIAFPLQLFASQCAVWVMRTLDIPVLRTGNIIELMPLGARETKKLEVAEACSGIRSLMTLVTLAVVFAYLTHPKDEGKGDGDGSGGGGRFDFLRRYSFWRAAFLIGAAVPIAILTNAARVSGTGILAHYYGMEVADGFFHSFSGWVMYIVAFVLLLAVGSLLDRLSGIGARKKENREASSVGQETKTAKAGARASVIEKAKSSIDALPIKGAGAD